MNRATWILSAAILSGACTSPSSQQNQGLAADALSEGRLPTGARLDPAGTSHDLGSFPLAMVLSPEKDRIVVLLNGWGTQGIQTVEKSTGRVTQTLSLPAVFLGLAFAPDGRSLYVSGGNEDAIYRYDWKERSATFADTIRLSPKPRGSDGRRYPAGIGVSPDGKTLYVAENLGDSLAVVDLESRRVIQRLGTDRYPYGVAVASDGTVYVSAWGDWTVSIFSPRAGGMLSEGAKVRVGRHPSALTLNSSGTRLFIASASTDRIHVMDTRSRGVIATLSDENPAGTGEGSTPNGVGLSADGKRLFVAEADNNAIGVFDLSATTADVPSSVGNDALIGRIPVGWYPSAVIADGADLFVLNAKGRGTRPNPGLRHPGQSIPIKPGDYTLGQLNGTLTVLSAAATDAPGLAAYSRRVATANGWNTSQRKASYPPFEHVIYVIKENRTYDQILGDLPQGDGDSSLVFFPRSVSPNHHALAERFGIFDRFFVNAEVSADGHNWSTAAYVTDYIAKTTPSNYSSRGRSYDFEGTNRDVVPEDDVAEAANGYLWNLAERAGITYRNYGAYVTEIDSGPPGARVRRYAGTKAALVRHTNTEFPGYDMDIPDQRRVDVWLTEFETFVKTGKLPAFQIVRLPNDHTQGASAGKPTPRAHMADNDLALGRMVEAVSKSPFWKNTVIFVLEDDAQDGPDHVDSHRSVLLVISPYNGGRVFHRFANTTDVLATIEDILGLGRLSQFDHYGRPLREIWEKNPDLRPYSALTPAVSLTELNPKTGALAEASKHLALDAEDEANEDLFNRILWQAIKGDKPYPGTKRISTLEAEILR